MLLLLVLLSAASWAQNETETPPGSTDVLTSFAKAQSIVRESGLCSAYEDVDSEPAVPVEVGGRSFWVMECKATGVWILVDRSAGEIYSYTKRDIYLDSYRVHRLQYIVKESSASNSYVVSALSQQLTPLESNINGKIDFLDVYISGVDDSSLKNRASAMRSAAVKMGNYVGVLKEAMNEEETSRKDLTGTSGSFQKLDFWVNGFQNVLSELQDLVDMEDSYDEAKQDFISSAGASDDAEVQAILADPHITGYSQVQQRDLVNEWAGWLESELDYSHDSEIDLFVNEYYSRLVEMSEDLEIRKWNESYVNRVNGLWPSVLEKRTELEACRSELGSNNREKLVNMESAWKSANQTYQLAGKADNYETRRERLITALDYLNAVELYLGQLQNVECPGGPPPPPPPTEVDWANIIMWLVIIIVGGAILIFIVRYMEKKSKEGGGNDEEGYNPWNSM
jgi:hypothetical protein